MTLSFTPASGLFSTLDLLRVEFAGAVGFVRLNRPTQRNEIDDTMVQQLQACFLYMPEEVNVESLRAAIAQGDDVAKGRVRTFLAKRAGKEEKQ